MEFYELKVITTPVNTVSGTRLRLSKSYYFENEHDMTEYKNMLYIKRMWKIRDNQDHDYEEYGNIEYIVSHKKIFEVSRGIDMVWNWDGIIPIFNGIVSNDVNIKIARSIIRNEIIVESEMLDKLKEGDVVYDGYYKDYVRIFNVIENKDGTISVPAETKDGYIEDIQKHAISRLRPEVHQIVGGPACYE